MYVKVTRSGPRRYVQLVESFRNAEGKVRQRTLATLGRLDRMDGALESVINGLLKITGRAAPTPSPPLAFESSRAFGDIWALQELWRSLGFSALSRTFAKTRYAMDVEALIRAMVFNRLCDPESKLGVLRWLETVAFPGLEVATVTHDHLLRAMDALIDRQASVDRVVAKLLCPFDTLRFSHAHCDRLAPPHPARDGPTSPAIRLRADAAARAMGKNIAGSFMVIKLRESGLSVRAVRLLPEIRATDLSVHVAPLSQDRPGCASGIRCEGLTNADTKA